MSDQTQVNCPHCGELNPAEAFFCGGCGKQVRSLMSGARGPVAEVDGDIEIKPLFPAEAAPVLKEQPQPSVTEFPPVGRAPTVADPPPPAPTPPGLPPPVPELPALPSDAGAGSPYQPPPHPSPPGGYPPATAPSFGMVEGTNTSGLGEGYLSPPEARGVTFGGCLPFGLFAFVNQSIGWGIVGLLGALIPYVGFIMYLVYALYIFANGRRLAWQRRRFDSVERYCRTMAAWNGWGLGYLAACLLLTLISILIAWQM